MFKLNIGPESFYKIVLYNVFWVIMEWYPKVHYIVINRVFKCYINISGNMVIKISNNIVKFIILEV